MTLLKLDHMVVTRVAVVVPSVEMSIEDDAVSCGWDLGLVRQIKETIGIDCRRVVPPGVTTADLCLHAAERFFEDIDRASVDAIICVTQTPDYRQPCNAAIIHGKLKMPHGCACFDINLGCSGYVYGLWTVGSLIETGALRRVLFLAGDTISQDVCSRDRTVAPLFGDAGSATLVEYQEDGDPSFFALNTDGSGYDALIIPSGGYRDPRNDQNAQPEEDAEGNWRSGCDLHMKGGDVFNFTIREVPKSVLELLEYSKTNKDDIDYFFMHQANRYILTNIAKRIKVPIEKVPCDIVSKYGNQSSASIPCVMAETLGGREEGSLKVVLSGFGVGLSWASAVLSLDSSVVLPLINYPEVGVTA